ncbi:acyl-CoA synthetase [Xenophilus aerolatus]|nr:acyl-CoA synthetase [Xenophilus aerolatus]
MLALRFICWVALRLGRPVARLILHPITLYFLLFAPTQRRHIRRYLERSVGPRAGWGDGYRLLHGFASTVLDRVYFLRGRLDLFDVNVTGVPVIEDELRAGRGAFLIGAHVGSFEALSACRQQGSGELDLQLAMLMFPDNARRINAVLDAISLPGLKPRVISLGRPSAMLELRDWLDAGHMAGMLGDRTLTPQEEAAGQRGSTLLLPFLGKEAPFTDGPFRLAALLRRKVLFMAGIYHGGSHYEVVFEPLADFSARITDPLLREQRIRAALEAYVRRLEALCRAHPHNWFNFHDFWQEDAQ